VARLAHENGSAPHVAAAMFASIAGYYAQTEETDTLLPRANFSSRTTRPHCRHAHAAQCLFQHA